MVEGGSRRSRFTALSFRVSDTLTRVAKKYVGPAQHGNFQPGTVVRPLDGTPCPICGEPMSAHELVHSSGKQRFYCPEPDGGAQPHA